jgi:hypothetical protein
MVGSRRAPEVNSEFLAVDSLEISSAAMAPFTQSQRPEGSELQESAETQSQMTQEIADGDAQSQQVMAELVATRGLFS